MSVSDSIKNEHSCFGESNHWERLSENFVKALKIDMVSQIPSCLVLSPILVRTQINVNDNEEI